MMMATCAGTRSRSTSALPATDAPRVGRSSLAIRACVTRRTRGPHRTAGEVADVGRTRRCGRCGGALPLRARWCGRCGHAVPGAATGSGTRTPRGRPHLPRRWLVLSVGGVVSVLVALTAADRAPRSDAPASAVDLPSEPAARSGGEDAGGASSAGEPCPVTAARAACVRWEARLSSRATARIAGGDVVTLDAYGTVRALSGGTGERRWRVELPDGGSARLLTPVAGTQPVHHGDRLSFLRLDDGRTLGSVDLDVAPLAADSHGASTVVHVPGRVTSYLVTGEVAWSREVPPTTRVELTSGGTYLTAGGTVVRLASDTGVERWRRDLAPDARVREDIHVRGHAVALSEGDRRVTALRASDGVPSWSLALPGPVTTLATSDRLLAALVASPDGEVQLTVARLGPDGDLRGEAAAVALPGAPRTTPPWQLATAGDTVTVVAPDGVVHLVTGDGLLAGRFEVDGPVTEVAMPDARTAVTVEAGRLVAWSTTSGRVRWEQRAPAPTLVAADPLVVVTDGTIVRLDPQADQRGSRS
ncbi:PQQ-binding-like beta-propeller repeat protein [Nitriliruptoraceae bacterium ZYF776]|nr:PQQ-binding-like beta-propeller repeat protein [Profundirhabdus halotolerans]